MFCTNCGKQVDENAKFCVDCGNEISQSTHPQQTSAKQIATAPEPAKNHRYEENEVITAPLSEEYDEDKIETAKEVKETLNQMANEENITKKKKMGIGVIIGLASSVAFGVVFIVGLIVAIASSAPTGNYILLISGIIEIITAVILYKVMDYRMKVTCPQCGTKRPHKRIYIQTDEKYTSPSNGRYEKITYTHRYEDYYICPKCNETFKQNIKKSGGYVSYDSQTGNTQDHRLPVREI